MANTSSSNSGSKKLPGLAELKRTCCAENPWNIVTESGKVTILYEPKKRGFRLPGYPGKIVDRETALKFATKLEKKYYVTEGN